jgi:hypothetical protein
MAFGLVSSYSWDKLGPAGDPWLDFVARLQRDFGPHYAGVPLSSYLEPASGVSESTFGDLDVAANRDPERSYTDGGYGISPNGFLAHTQDGSLLAGTFVDAFNGVTLSPGTHYVVIERAAASVVVRQPIGAETELAIDPPAARASGQELEATALAGDGTPLGTVPGTIESGRFVFDYAGQLDGHAVAAYRIAAA